MRKGFTRRRGFRRRLGRLLGVCIGFLSMFSPGVEAADVLVLHDETGWDAGVTWWVSHDEWMDVSWDNLMEHHGQSSRWEALAAIGFRPRAGHRWEIAVRRVAEADYVRTISIVDPLHWTEQNRYSAHWQDVDIHYERTWTKSAGRAWRMRIGAGICVDNPSCRLTWRGIDFRYTRIVDPVVLGASLNLAGSDEVSGKTPMIRGLAGALSADIVISPSLALGITVSGARHASAPAGGETWGWNQRIVWKWDQDQHISVGFGQNTHHATPVLNMGFHTVFK